MKKVQILRFDHIHSDGDLFTNETVITCKNKVLMLKDFDHGKPLGKVNVFKEKDGLYAEINPHKFNGLYPSIGFELIKSHAGGKGITNITEIKLHYVGLSENPNIDPEIKPI